MRFTTSWDDGYALDLKLSTTLEQYGLTGTFYVCPQKQHQKPMLSNQALRLLSEHHEIGAHTLRHVWLTKVPPVEAEQEISESKKWIEQITQKECTMFCYPYGDTNEHIERLVKKAGFYGARNTQMLEFDFQNPFAIPTTLQVIPFPRRRSFSRFWHPLDPFGPLRVRYRKLRKVGVPLRSMGSWLSMATALFDRALKNDLPLFHLWGHSAEIEKYDMWQDLEIFLHHVKESGVECITNSDITQS